MSDLREKVDGLVSRAWGWTASRKTATDAILALVAEDRRELVEALEKVRSRLELIITAKDRGFGLAYIEGCAQAGREEIDAVLAKETNQ